MGVFFFALVFQQLLLLLDYFMHLALGSKLENSLLNVCKPSIDICLSRKLKDFIYEDGLEFQLLW